MIRLESFVRYAGMAGSFVWITGCWMGLSWLQALVSVIGAMLWSWAPLLPVLINCKARLCLHSRQVFLVAGGLGG